MTVQTIIDDAHESIELLIRGQLTPDIEEVLKLLDNIILKASELKKEEDFLGLFDE